MLKITTHKENKVIRFVVEGKLTSASISVLENCWLDAKRSAVSEIHFEFHDITFIDDSATPCCDIRQEFERLGNAKTQKVDVRLIAATNCDLEQMVADHKYRSDLYYRINGFPITIPPLRERKEDIPELTRFFVQKYARRMKKQIDTISAEAMDALIQYHWPGNIRELEHFIERAAIFTQGSELEVSTVELKPKAMLSDSPASTLEDSERQHILRALQDNKLGDWWSEWRRRSTRNQTNDASSKDEQAGNRSSAINPSD